MITAEFMKEVKTFLEFLGQGDFGYQLQYDNNIANRIINHYLPSAQSKPEEIKRKCLEIMKTSCDSNEDHGHLPDWKGTLMNIIVFCIIPTVSFHEIEEIQKQSYNAFEKPAISSVVRFSRWYHTERNFWIRFEPYAKQIGGLLWGDMEVLNKYNP
jgi:hypothetical protein